MPLITINQVLQKAKEVMTEYPNYTIDELISGEQKKKKSPVKLNKVVNPSSSEQWADLAQDPDLTEDKEVVHRFILTDKPDKYLIRRKLDAKIYKPKIGDCYRNGKKIELPESENCRCPNWMTCECQLKQCPRNIHPKRLDEIFKQNEIHYNINIHKLKAIAKDSKYHEARFVWKAGRLHGADASHHDHYDIRGMDYQNNVEGYIAHDPKTDSHTYSAFTGRFNSIDDSKDYPILKHFEKHGVKNLLSKDINEISDTKALSYMNKVQDKIIDTPYHHLDARFKAYDTVQKKLGWAKGKAKVSVTRKKKLEELLEESLFSDKVHHNPAMETLKNIATESKGKKSRFIIRNNGKWSGGDASNFTHTDLADSNESYMDVFNNIKVAGFVYSKRGKHTYSAWKGLSTEKYEGPELEKLHKAGITLDPKVNERSY